MYDYNGTGTACSYYDNKLPRVTKAGKHTVEHIYDDLGQLLTISDSAGTIRYEYDEYGRIASRETAAGEKIEYGYDAFGRMNEITTSVGTTRYGFDKYNRLTSVTDHAGNKTTYTYDNVGNKASQTNPDGSVTTYTYDACNRLTKEETRDKDGNLLADYTYTFNGNGQKVETKEVVKTAEGNMAASITTYAYDKANRLTKEEKSVLGENGTTDDTIVEYFYDNAGNRTKKVEDGVETEYTYNELNQLQSEMTEGKETISYAYDKNGNLLCRGTTTEYETYTYTVENMLESVTSTTRSGETKETYTYDAEGNRLSKTESKAIKSVNETTGEVTTTWEETDKTYYVMDTSGAYAQVIAELDADRQVKVLYTRGDGIISREEVEEDGTVSMNFYFSDGHGDVRQLTDETGAVTDSYRYNSFGELKESRGETDNPYLYTGEYYDEGTGLYYLRARYMNPVTGTFTSMDTYRGNAYDPASLHRYTYAQNNPQMYKDPSGHMGVFIGAIYRNQYNIQIMGMVNGMINSIINEVFGGQDKQDPMVAFMIGYATGIGCAALYYGAAAIQGLAIVMATIEMISLTEEVIQCVTHIVMSLVCGVTGHRTQMLIHGALAVICLIDVLVEFGCKGEIDAAGPKGKVKYNVDGQIKETSEKFSKLLNSEYYKNDLGYDCSEIAIDFFDAAGRSGKIYRIEGKNGTINGYEYGEIWEFEYHDVYSDGTHIYDPRYSNVPVLKDEFFKVLKAINPDGFDVFTL